MTVGKLNESRTQRQDKLVAETITLLNKEIPPKSQSSKFAKDIAYRLISLGYIYPKDITRMLVNLYTAAKED